MNTSMELVYGLLLLIFILGLTELLAFAIALIRREDTISELHIPVPDRLQGFAGNDSSVPQESTESGSAFDTAP